MRGLVIVGALALILAGCLQRTQTRDAAQSCSASASTPWQVGDTAFTVEASTSGPGCERAVATLTIRGADGTPAWTQSHITAQVMTLANARDTPAMEAALAEWIDPANNTTMQTSSALPDWPENADGPVSGEFPFYAEPAYARESYLELRAANAPLYCYVQGMESMACIAYSNVSFDRIGVQTFPG